MCCITDFYLFGQPVRQGMTSGGQDIIDCPVFEAQTFRLAHQDNSFGIEFSTQELDNTDRVVYTYTMNNNQWTTLPQGTNRVSFSNLAPGTYHFSLKAKDGIIESDVKEITIFIAQPGGTRDGHGCSTYWLQRVFLSSSPSKYVTVILPNRRWHATYVPNNSMRRNYSSSSISRMKYALRCL